MPEFGTYGINFPLTKSRLGYVFDLTESPEEEIKADLIHLLLTRKGMRYFLPDFGTRLYEYIFEPMDNPTFDSIEAEIREQVDKYIPNLRIDKIIITPMTEAEDTEGTLVNTNDDRVYRVSDTSTEEYTAKVRIDFTSTSSAFETKDFVIINL
jgi:phage baseplate assembly protein W|tara:strand:- start:4370 stop:4828 length:459 start_codon:yes stop_codon:yes gene_type:complete